MVSLSFTEKIHISLAKCKEIWYNIENKHCGSAVQNGGIEMRVKKFLAGMLSVSMLSMMCAGSLTASVGAADALCGDVDGSGHVNPGDTIAVLNTVSGAADTEFAPEIADVNRDGNINECDAAAIAAYYMGKIDALPAEAPLTVEPVEPFPHEFSFSIDNVNGYAGTTIPVNIYLDQSKDYDWLYELDAMRLTVATESNAGIKINSVYMNANFWIGNTDGTAVISGAYVRDEDITKPIATVYLEVSAGVLNGTYAVDFVAEDCFIGDIYGQTADKVSFTGGSVTINTAPETLPTTVTTTTTAATTTTEATETDNGQTDFPEETSPVPDTTEALDTTVTADTEQTIVQTTANDFVYERTIEIESGRTEYIVGETLDLYSFTASVYSEAEGCLVGSEYITNSKYFKVDDSAFDPSTPGKYTIIVYYADDPSVYACFDVEVFPADTTTTTDFFEETTTMTTSLDTTAPPVEETATETTETPADTTCFDSVGTVVTTETTIVTTWNTTLPTTETTIVTTSGPVEETTETTESTTDTQFDPVGTVVTDATTWNTTLPTTDMTTTTLASTLDDNGNVIYGTTMPAETSPSGSDSEEESITTATSETYDGSGTDWVGSEEVNGTTAVASDADTTETTTVFTEIAPEDPVETEVSTEIAPETTETTASEADTEDATEPAETLPQTGNPAWFGWMIAFAAMLMTAGGWMMMQSGIFKREEE